MEWWWTVSWKTKRRRPAHPLCVQFSSQWCEGSTTSISTPIRPFLFVSGQGGPWKDDHRFRKDGNDVLHQGPRFTCRVANCSSHFSHAFAFKHMLSRNEHVQIIWSVSVCCGVRVRAHVCVSSSSLVFSLCVGARPRSVLGRAPKKCSLTSSVFS